MTSSYAEIMRYGSDTVSVIFFIVWFFQITRSGIYYYRFATDARDLFDLAFIHSILFVANIFYLVYEFDVVVKENPIWLIFSMYFLLNIASIWAFALITLDNVTGKSSISPGSQKLYKALIFLLVLVYCLCWIEGNYGVKCSQNAYPKGLGFMSAFTIVWSIFVLYQLKNDKMLKLRKEGIKAVL